MTDVTSTVDIDAPARLVWQALTDFERYPGWNPYFRHASGVAAPGETILLGATLDEGFGKPRQGPVRVITATPEAELRWTSRFLLPGLMDADHRFTLTALSPTRTRLAQSEKLTGLLVALSPATMKKIQVKLGEFDLALKAYAEGLATRTNADDTRA